MDAGGDSIYPDGNASCKALAKYLREACDYCESKGHKAILVTVPVPFNLPIFEARAIADRLDPAHEPKET